MRIKLLLIIFGLANSFCFGLSLSLYEDKVINFSSKDLNLQGLFPPLAGARGCKFSKIDLFHPPPPASGGESHRKSLGFNKNFKILKNLSDSTYQLLQTIPINSTYLIADNLQNIYVATEKGQVVKFDKNGKQQFEYNNNRLGEIGKIDVRNPLTILVYYPDLAVVVILDRTLSPIKELNLYDVDIIAPKDIALANDNNIWVYDEVTRVLKKISQTGQTLFESRNLNQLTQKKISPTFLLEKDNLIYLSDLENGLFVFDNFGQLKQEVPIKGLHRFQVVGQQLIFEKENQYFQLFLDTLEKEKIVLPKLEMVVENLFVSGQLIYLMHRKTIEIYQYSY